MPALLLSGIARRVMFAPLDLEGGRGVAVANRLGDSIALGLLHDGEQLPAQSELAAALGVSLVTLRDGLELLKGRGLIETRRGHGGGSFVKVDERVSTNLHRERLRRMSSHDLGDLADVQRAISGQAARLAAERHTWDFVARLGRLVDALESADSTAAGSRIDGRFRVEVAATAQSVRLTHHEMQLQAEVTALRWLPSLDDAGREDRSSVTDYHAEVLASHRGLLDAISREASAEAQAVAEARVDADLERLLTLHIQALGRP